MSESSRPDAPRRLSSILPMVGMIAVAGILLAALFRSPWEQERILPPSFDAKAPPPRAVTLDFSGYVGEQSCAECHPGEAAAHSSSGHSHTLWNAAEGNFARWLSGQRLKDPEHPGVEWSYHLRDKNLEVERSEGGNTKKMTLELGLGSGAHGITLMTLTPSNEAVGPAAIEHRFSYLSPTGKMEITPGQELEDAKNQRLALTDFGRSHLPARVRDCLACHATLTSRTKLDHLDPKTMVPNVSCERCHGPGRDHIAAARAGNSEDLKMPMTLLTDARYQVEQCGECHRLPSKVDRESLHPDNPDISRFQSVGISMSACFKDGTGTFKCSTCHEVHAPTSRDRTAYVEACLGCHRQGSTEAERPCPVSPTEKCIDCHMPRVKVPGGWTFTNHWIRKPGEEYRGGASPPPPPSLGPRAVQ